MNFKAMIHSEEEKGVQSITILDKPDPDKNLYIVLTPSGKKCTAIFNVFSGLYYADDVYGLRE